MQIIKRDGTLVEFDKTRIVNAINAAFLEVDGKLCYYEDGVGVEKGLFKYEESYYFAQYKGRLVVNQTFRAYLTSCELPIDTYTFGADGKMVGASAEGEIVEIDGKLYYYELGRGVEKYLVCVDGDYYFAQYKGKLVVSQTFRAFATNCDKPIGTYTFGADGKMLDGFVTKADGIYYYENGAPGKVGLNLIDGYYYFVDYSGKIVTNTSYYVWATNGYTVGMTYRFDALGRVIL